VRPTSLSSTPAAALLTGGAGKDTTPRAHPGEASRAPVDRERRGPLTVGILALQGDVAEHWSVLAELGVRPLELRRPSDLADIDALVLPGGESTTMSVLLESSGLFDPLSRALAAGLPVLGTCAGMILLSREVLDGRDDQRCFSAIDISVRRNAFGRQQQSFECDLEVAGLEGGPMRAVFIRAPAVERAGPGVEVLATVEASTPHGPVRRPVVCRQGPVLVSAFHPELSGDRRLHELLLSNVGQRAGTSAGRR
jgi:pyridoxal 5'-phosphate synthase pdxT subunit